MTFRVLMFFALLFAAAIFLIQLLGLPVDALLFLLALLAAFIVGLFAHYRYVGRLRTFGEYEKALKHLWVWRLFLPFEAYMQQRLQILVEAGDEERLKEAMEKARKRGIAPLFLNAFWADFKRRKGKPEESEELLLEALESEPIGIVKAGLLTQLARLYVNQMPDKRLNKVGLLLNEAEQLAPRAPHKHLIQATRGEWMLARKKSAKAVELLQKSLDALLLNPLKNPTWWQRIEQVFIHLTYSQQDEHQFPLFAELLLSLGRAYKALGHKEKAKEIFRQALAICQQDFVAIPLRQELESL